MIATSPRASRSVINAERSAVARSRETSVLGHEHVDDVFEGAPRLQEIPDSGTNVRQPVIRTVLQPEDDHFVTEARRELIRRGDGGGVERDRRTHRRSVPHGPGGHWLVAETNSVPSVARPSPSQRCVACGSGSQSPAIAPGIGGRKPGLRYPRKAQTGLVRMKRLPQETH